MNYRFLVALSASFLFTASPVLAHVTVKPNEVGIGSFQTFSVSVPVEKEIPTTALRLVIPTNLQYVTPTVKPGWTISVKKTDSGAVSEISWTGGQVPAGQRDDFSFSAQAPATATTLQWKAYQTSQDRTVVSWDQDPYADHTTHMEPGADSEEMTPFSETKVVDDLAPSAAPVGHPNDSDNKALVLSITALIVALCSFTILYFRR